MLSRTLLGLRFVSSLLLLLLLQPVLAVYQDEAYNTDFAFDLLGAPLRQSTFFHRPDAASKATLLYSLSERGVLGAVNPRDGSLVWRALANDTITDFEQSSNGVLRAHESCATIVSGLGSTVRAWDAKDGRVVWEWQGEDTVKSLAFQEPSTGLCDALILTKGKRAGGSLYRLSGADGKIQWTQELAESDIPLAISTSATQVFVTSLMPSGRNGYKIRVQTVDTATGKDRHQQIINSDGEILAENFVMHVSDDTTAPLIAWTDRLVTKIFMNVLGSKHTTVTTISSSEAESITGIRILEPSSTTATPHFLLSYNRAAKDIAEVFHIDASTGKLKQAFALHELDSLGQFSASTIGTDFFLVRHTDSETTLISSVSADVLQRWATKPQLFDGKPNPSKMCISNSVSELITKGDKQYSVRTAVVAADDDWELYQNGNHIWTRYEGLAGLVTAAFIEIPRAASLAKALSVESHSNLLSAYIHRTRRHLEDLRHLPKWLQAVPSRLVNSLTGLDLGDGSKGLPNDSFGFRKAIVVATDKGRVAVLSSLPRANHPQIIWTARIPTPDPNRAWAGRMKTEGTTVTISIEPDKIAQLDFQSGAVVSGSDESQKSDACEMSVTKDGTPDVCGILRPTLRVVTRRNDGSVVGWKPTTDGKETSLAWSFLPKNGESIISVTSRPAHDPVASIGRARGDRNVLYKYLSPNLAVVTATNTATSSLSVYLLDTITGQVLYTTTHDGVDTSQTIATTFSENWFAYSMFTDVPQDSGVHDSASASTVKGYQLVVAELFESPFPNERGPLEDAKNFSSIDTTYLPHVESAAYTIPAPLTALATTSTLQGITPRSLLAYSPFLSALIAIPVPFLSPRRPVGRDATIAEREEGLVRYQASLDLAPVWFLSHQRELLGIDNIISNPTNMESSSLVFAFGKLDLFGTRVSPIGAFDVLGKGFGKLQLIMTVVALSVGTSLLAPLARRKGIDSLWRS